ncbi:MAG: hypothetical protein F4Y82_02695 [Cenarchaeum sp. SB0665_bin_23]|nr:hypothetical protein [Cenarchaeum sp. SB0665_bin_23]MYG32952.1 hypothetical protein [Cenarchaeum sp. SB0677_bin_16]
MEPFFVICLECHNAYTWHHRDEPECPNGCDIRYSMPWNGGFGPDRKPTPKHDSVIYDKYTDEWPDPKDPDFYVKNLSEMKQKCQ